MDLTAIVCSLMQSRFRILARRKIFIETDRDMIIHGAYGTMCSTYVITYRASRRGLVKEHNLNVHNSLN
jgi:hypothetical protein